MNEYMLNMLYEEVSNANLKFIEDLARYEEEYTMMTESKDISNDTIITKIEKFFASIITTLNKYRVQIKNIISKGIRRISMRIWLKTTYDRFVKEKEKGTKSVTMPDYKALLRSYKDAVTELSICSKKFAKTKYNSTLDIDKDIEKFNKISSKYEQEIKKIEEATVTVKIDTAIQWIEYEVSGKGTTIQSINDAIETIDYLHMECVNISKRKDILGPNVIPKHIGFIRKIIMNINKTLHRLVGKFIGGVVFTFA